MSFLSGAGESFIIVGVVALAGIVAFLVVGYPWLHRLGDRFASGSSSSRVQPQYSIAEARAQQGRYAESIAEFRKVIQQFPEDVYAHIRIADLALDRFGDLATAETELRTAFGKATSDDGLALAGNRLADLYQSRFKDTRRAIETLEAVSAKVPTSKHGRRARERILLLAASRDAA